MVDLQEDSSDGAATLGPFEDRWVVRVGLLMEAGNCPGEAAVELDLDEGLSQMKEASVHVWILAKVIRLAIESVAKLDPTDVSLGLEGMMNWRLGLVDR